VKRSIEKPIEKRVNSNPRGPKCVTSPNRPDGYPWDYQTPGAGNLPPPLRNCGVNMTQACYKALYSIPDPPQKVDPGNSLGLYEQGDYFSKEDLDLFYATYAPWIPQGTYPIPDLIDGANYSVSQHSSLDTGESEIDMTIA
jgi:tripeptidyl-peptidase-1